MKSKQTLKVGRIVVVIKTNSEYFNKIGTIIKYYGDGSFSVGFSDGNEVIFLAHELQLITQKKSQWKYSREEIKSMLETLDVTNGRLKTIYDMVLVKSTPKKKSKEIKKIDYLKIDFESSNEINIDRIGLKVNEIINFLKR